nr:helix-turn-helix domain-containing protein [uncultured Peptostreptococcus sp.]
MIKLGCSISSIARYLNRSRTTIYNELKGGSVEQINISVYL